MTIYIYSGAGAGESRQITAYNKDTRLVTTAAFATTLHDKGDATPSKYRIFRWETDNWEITNNEKDFVVTDRDGFGGIDGSAFLATTNTTAAGDNASADLGNISFVSSGESTSKHLKLTPGVDYTLEFDCAAKDKWHNLVSAGNTNGSGTQYGDKPKWIELYSTTVSDSSGSARKFTSITGASQSGNWEPGYRWAASEPSATSGNGSGLSVLLFANGPDGETVSMLRIEYGGIDYAVGDTVTFTDPGDTDETVVYTIASGGVNNVGLALYDGGSSPLGGWMTQASNASVVGSDIQYLANTGNNFVVNGDFTNGGSSLSQTGEGDYLTGWTKTGDLSVASFNYLASSVFGSGTYSIYAQYGGHDGGIRIASEPPFGDSYVQYIDGVPTVGGADAYIYQDLSLDANTHYYLNFFWAGGDRSDGSSLEGGIAYAIYDTQENTYLTPWTQTPNMLGFEYKGTNSEYYANVLGIENWKQYNKIPSGPYHPCIYDEDTLKQKYHKFYVPHYLNNLNNNRTIQIRFSLMNNHNTSFLSSVSVYKANYDLATLSYNSGG